MPLSIEEAKAIIRRVGKAELEFMAMISAPLYWAMRYADGSITARNGTAFFLRTPSALFGVTAAHVIEGPRSWREHCEEYGPTSLRLGTRNSASVILDWDAHAVDIDLDIDIATFTISISPRRSPQSGGGVAAGGARAAADRMRRIGVLMNLRADDPKGQARLAAFLQGLQEAGWADRRNARIDTRWAAGDADHLRKYAAELIALAPEVILATATPAVTPLQQASRTVPIVFVAAAGARGYSRPYRDRRIGRYAFRRRGSSVVQYERQLAEGGLRSKRWTRRHRSKGHFPTGMDLSD